MNKKKKATLAIALLLSVCVVATTFAIFIGNTATLKNTFTKSAGISISLREPSWDGYEFSDDVEGIALGTKKNPAKADVQLGIDQAGAYMPEDRIQKDPTLRLEDGSEDAWVAIKVEFFNHNNEAISEDAFVNTYGAISMSNEFELIDRKANYSLYMYKTKMAAASTSDPLFKEVVINDDIAFVNGVLPSFRIATKGYAVQAKGLNYSEAMNELIEMSK